MRREALGFKHWRKVINGHKEADTILQGDVLSNRVSVASCFVASEVGIVGHDYHDAFGELHTPILIFFQDRVPLVQDRLKHSRSTRT